MIFIEINDFLKSYSNLIPIITLFIGLWLGHRFSIGKDRRAELLVISVPIHDELVRQLSAEGDAIFNNPVKENDLIRLRSRYLHRTWFDRIKGMGIDAAIAEYNNEYKNSYKIDNTGRAVFFNHEKYRQTIQTLLNYAPIK